MQPHVELTDTSIIIKLERGLLEPKPQPQPTEPLTTLTKLTCPVCAYEGKPSMKLPLNLLHTHVKMHYEKLTAIEKLAKAERERDELAAKHAEAIASKKAFDERFPNMNNNSPKPTWSDTWRAEAEAAFDQQKPCADEKRPAEDRKVYIDEKRDRPQATEVRLENNMALAENLALLESSYEHLGMDEDAMLAAAMNASIADMEATKVTPLRQIVTNPNVRFNPSACGGRPDFD